MVKTKTKRNEKTVISQGFLYPLINGIFNLLKYLSLVEGYKYIGKKLAGNNKPLSINYSRMSVDMFIISKWLFVAILWIFRIKIFWLVCIVWYLLCTNLYTYFYYHTWSSEILNDTNFDTDRIKRRFTTLSLAISYSIFGFAYFYGVPYSNSFSWSNGSPVILQSLWFSIANSLTASYDQVKPITDFGYSITMIQLLIMFAFLTIIIGGAIPQPNHINKEG